MIVYPDGSSDHDGTWPPIEPGKPDPEQAEQAEQAPSFTLDVPNGAIALGRPLSYAEADGRPAGCHCDYNPDTTEGPDEFCPVHGRPYDEVVDLLSDSIRGHNDLRQRLGVVLADAKSYAGHECPAYRVLVDDLEQALNPTPPTPEGTTPS